MADMIINEGKHVDPGDAIDLLYKWLAIDTDMGIDAQKAEDLILETKALLGVDERSGLMDTVIRTGDALLGNIYDAELNCNDDGVEYKDVLEFAAALDAFKAIQ